MGIYTVARDDFRNARRSSIVLGVIGVFAALMALIFLAEMDIYDDPYRTLFDALFFVSLVLPLLLAPLCYLSIAGDRISGTITYVMGLPNRRWEYFAGKFLSRFAVAAAAIALSTAVGFAIAAVTFANVPSIRRFLIFGGVSLLYALAFSSLFVAISAGAPSRSRAMFGAIGAYFVLIVFWFGFFPFIRLSVLLDTIADLPWVTLSETTRAYIEAVSPGTAYLQGTKPVFSGVMGEYEAFERSFRTSDELHTEFWFNALVLLAWSAVSLTVGYLSFRRSELG
ncbi:MAG TPA: ABC transporter permease subunit [Natrialbaceae archaeon]|nr:ABC transporter permease subunit [Natrialbaceae archaeon]